MNNSFEKKQPKRGSTIQLRSNFLAVHMADSMVHAVDLWNWTIVRPS